jgi:hypothetical protein
MTDVSQPKQASKFESAYQYVCLEETNSERVLVEPVPVPGLDPSVEVRILRQKSIFGSEKYCILANRSCCSPPTNCPNFQEQ